MSLPNPKDVVTEQRLNEYHENFVLPYLGGSADAGFTPVGSIIAIMGVTAPANYLACDGTVYNIADYPELATYFYQQFGSKNKFGGDGTTTFAVPDLRGEFLRGTGTNSHENCGNGANVGVHQDSTKFPVYALDGTTFAVFDNGTYNYPKMPDSVVDRTNTRKNFASSGSFSVSNIESTITARPTNTSVLFCIATKNIYLDPKNDYSTEEKIVGTWIDGKPLYQRVLVSDPLGLNFDVYLTFTDMDKADVVYLNGFVTNTTAGRSRPIPNAHDRSMNGQIALSFGRSFGVEVYCRDGGDQFQDYIAYVIIRYTKTT